MTDWVVSVQTKSGYIKQVIVYDYNFPDDAVDAALAQTGGVRTLGYSAYYPSTNNKPEDRYYNKPEDRYYENSDYTQNNYSVSDPDKTMAVLLFVFIGLFCLLTFSPVLGIIIISVTAILAEYKFD